MIKNKNVLIAYASRYGTTAETAKDIGKFLKEQEIETTLVDLKHTKGKNWPTIDNFSGVIVASGIMMGRWMKEPQKFLRKNQEKLAQPEKILGVFVSCGCTITDPEKAENDYLVKQFELLGVKPQIAEPFGPIFDFSATSQLGWFPKKILKSPDLQAPYIAKGFKIDNEGRNDLRVLDQIRDFADRFAKLLNP